MKPSILLLLAAASLADSPPALAQRVSGGLVLHFNSASMTGTGSAIRDSGDESVYWERRDRMGLRAGAFADVTLSARLAIRAGVAYSMNGTLLEFRTGDPRYDPVITLTFGADYLELPLMGKLRLLEGGLGTLSLLAGPAVAVKARAEASATSHVFGETCAQDALQHLNRVDYRVVIGGEAEIKIGFQTLLLDFRYARGISDPWTTDGAAYPLQATTKHETLSAGLGLRLF